MKIEPCYRCSTKVTDELPKAGLTRLWGKISRDTWRIKFTFLRMNTWENAVTAADVVQSSFWTEATLCSSCWGDVLEFINKKIKRSS